MAARTEMITAMRAERPSDDWEFNVDSRSLDRGEPGDPEAGEFYVDIEANLLDAPTRWEDDLEPGVRRWFAPPRGAGRRDVGQGRAGRSLQVSIEAENGGILGTIRITPDEILWAKRSSKGFVGFSGGAHYRARWLGRASRSSKGFVGFSLREFVELVERKQEVARAGLLVRRRTDDVPEAQINEVLRRSKAKPIDIDEIIAKARAATNAKGSAKETSRTGPRKEATKRRRLGKPSK